ncbi:recombinase family protein [Alsobacter sp. SYSU BS001988]
MRAVIYARYSSDRQSDASIEDQLEVCRRYARAQGWRIVDAYTDAAPSDASRFRLDFQKLTADARLRPWEMLICKGNQ